MNSTPQSQSTDSSSPVSTQSVQVHSSGRLQGRSDGVSLSGPDAQIPAISDADESFFAGFLSKDDDAPGGPAAPPSAGAPGGRQAAPPTQPAVPATPTPPAQPLPSPATPEKQIVFNLDATDESYQDENGTLAVPPVAPVVQPATPAAPANPAAPALPAKRNLEGLPPEIAKVVPQMSNKAWAQLEPVLREHQAMQSERYADHPEGYLLAPEYSQMLSYYSTTQQEVDFATEQLTQARAGENFYVLTFDENGKPVKQGPYQSTTESVKALEGLILDGKSALQKVQQEAAAFKERFAETHKKVDARISEILKPIFEPYKDQIESRIDKALEPYKLPKYVTQRRDLRNQVGMMLLFQSATREVARLQAVIAASGGSAAPTTGGGSTLPTPSRSSKAITAEDEKFFNKFLPA